jgi:hypothetical protein
MANVVTYPAVNLGAPKRAPTRRNARSEQGAATVAALLGIGVMAISGAAALKWKKPVLALGGLLAGTAAAALAFEATKATR